MPNAAHSYIAAAAAVEVVSAGAPKKRIQLLPLGAIVLRDGRGPFNMSKEVAHAVIAATRQRAGNTDIMIDYDHQSFYGAVEGVGGRAEAAGWISPASLSVEADGIWADVSWTPAAEAKLAAREYRYLSPLFTFDPATKAVRAIRNAGLTNTPAIDELVAVASANPNGDPSQPAANSGRGDQPETPMDLSKIAVAAGLAASAPEGEIVAKVTLLATGATALAVASQQLGLKADATAEQLVAAAAKPDPAQYVPIAVVTELRADVAALRQATVTRDAEAVVAAALKDGKISPAMKGWADDYAKKDLAGFQAYVDKAPAIIAASALELEAEGGAGKSRLTATEAEVVAKLGLTPERFVAAKEA
jgi:phage I-like protein